MGTEPPPSSGGVRALLTHLDSRPSHLLPSFCPKCFMTVYNLITGDPPPPLSTPTHNSPLRTSSIWNDGAVLGILGLFGVVFFLLPTNASSSRTPGPVWTSVEEDHSSSKDGKSPRLQLLLSCSTVTSTASGSLNGTFHSALKVKLESEIFLCRATRPFHRRNRAGETLLHTQKSPSQGPTDNLRRVDPGSE